MFLWAELLYVVEASGDVYLWPVLVRPASFEEPFAGPDGLFVVGAEILEDVSFRFDDGVILVTLDKIAESYPCLCLL